MNSVAASSTRPHSLRTQDASTSDASGRITTQQRTPSFAAPKTHIAAPPPSSYWTQARLAMTCAQALPMLATIKLFARPAPGVSDNAIEAERNLPRQTDVAARQEAIAVHPSVLDRFQLPKSLYPHTNGRWLADGFQLVLGAGFFGMYQHAGVLRAIAAAGLHGKINELCGLSSGAITGALYATLGPGGMTDSILNLSLLDFLDLSPTMLVRQGALCAGQAVEAKVAKDTGQYGCTRIEDAPGARLRIAVFHGDEGQTIWHTEGPLAKAVVRSAALPVLFANDGHLDGGWVDHHGFTALRPHQRALSVRMNTGLEPDEMQKLVCRPKPLFNISTDPQHKTVALKPANKIDAKSFIFDIDFRKDKLVDIINESEALFQWWLHQPAA